MIRYLRDVAICCVLLSYEREREQRLLQQHHAAVAAAIPAHEMGPHSAYKRPRLDVRPELTQPLRIDTRTDDKQRLNLYKPVCTLSVM